MVSMDRRKLVWLGAASVGAVTLAGLGCGEKPAARGADDEKGQDAPEDVARFSEVQLGQAA
jgi:hypothetical protein